MRLSWSRRAGKPIDGEIWWEVGPRPAPDWRPERVAVLAHWSADGSLSKSVTTLVSQIGEQGFEVLVTSAAQCAGGSRTGAGSLPPGVTVLGRPNSGYDFGTWSAVLAAYPMVRLAREVILLNDSMAGPFGDITPVLKRMLCTPCDVWSLTESYQFRWHPQSYFVGYRAGVLDEPPMRRFFDGVHVHEDKRHVINNYELGQGRLLQREGYATSVAFPAAVLTIPPRENPTIKAWRALLDAGLPMIKRQLLGEPEVAEDSGDIADEVLRRYDTDIKEWL